MGMFDKFKEAKNQRALRKAAEKEQAQYELELKNWELSKSCGERMLDAFESINKGEDAVETNAVLKKGEYAFWTGVASYHESRRQAGTYVGRSSGVSIPIGGTGLRYRVGATKGTFIPGDDVQTTLDRGNVLMTTHRLIFNGNIKTQEWAFAKWTGADASDNEMSYEFHVTNRQKTSGITFNDFILGQEFNRFLGAILRVERDGIPALIKSLKETLKETEAEKPTPPKSIAN